jgi:MFS family permease
MAGKPSAKGSAADPIQKQIDEAWKLFLQKQEQGEAMYGKILKSTVSGVIGGLLVGALVGAYFVVQTSETVIQRDDYKTSVLYEQAETRYKKTILAAFSISFAMVGAFVANATFGSWLSPAIYGMLGSVAVVVAVTIVVAALTNQQPINMQKGSSRACIDVARSCGLPVAVVFGPILGVLVGTWRSNRHRQSSAKAG